MATQKHDSRHFAEKVRQIRASVPPLLAQWGLRSVFSRWRLAQDPGTGLVVLFGVLNDKSLPPHPATPFNDYFAPRVLLDLAMELKVPVMPSNGEGLRYAFILDRGKFGPLPSIVASPGLDHSQLLVETPDAMQSLARVWDKPMVVVDMTESDQPGGHPEDYQALVDFQLTLRDAQAAPALLIQPLPSLITPNHGLASFVALPTILAQVEAEVERRQVMYSPWSRAPQDLNGPNTTPMVKSALEPSPHIVLVMTEQRIHADQPEPGLTKGAFQEDI